MKKAQVPPIEQIEKFLTSCGIDWKRDELEVGFNRNIKFEVYGIKYRITWFVNQCTLMILNDNPESRYAQIPFMDLKLDTTAPIAPHKNRSIVFYTFLEGGRMIYESFRIPLTLS